MDELMLFQTRRGPVVRSGPSYFPMPCDWDELVNDDILFERLTEHCGRAQADDSLSAECEHPLAPIGAQEVWAAGVTYYRSRMARVEESKTAGGDGFYDRVYDAARPELFMKATRQRVVGPGEAMHLRRDSRWIVPEPELVLMVSRRGTIVGYTAGNDLSCRDIEGENPLYLPQAKTFERCAALGPGLLIAPRPAADAVIHLTIRREGEVLSSDATSLSEMKRSPEELVDYLMRDNSFPLGCFLMTGTGIVPPADLSLQRGDVVDIAIDGIGTLSNPMD